MSKKDKHTPEAARPLADRMVLAILGLTHVVCPLLFFTNLTRNPYYTQIALLNAGVLAAAVLAAAHQARSGRFRLPRTAVDLPMFVFLGICLLSFAYSYFAHAAFFRDSIRSEGVRIFLFLIGNSMVPFYLAAASSEECADEPEVPVGKWAIFVVVWAGLWTLYPQLRGG